MTSLNRATATAISLPDLPTFVVENRYPLSRIKREVEFAIAQRAIELSASGAPLVTDWINDAYTQILGMTEPQSKNFSTTFTLPAEVTTLSLPSVVYDVHALSSVIDGQITPITKSIDIEYWRSIQQSTDLDLALLNFYQYRDARGLMLQFHPQSLPVSLVADLLVRPAPLVADTDCPALEDAVCIGLIDMAISIAMRRLGEHTYAGVQNNAALSVIRSQIDPKADSRRGVVAAVTRPRTWAEARRPNAS